MTYLKHNSTKGKSKSKAAKKPDEPINVVVRGLERDADGMPAPSIQHDLNYVDGLGGIEESLDWIAKGLARLTSEDYTVNLTLGQGANISPVKITLAENDFDNGLDRLLTALERIADALAVSKAP